MVGELMLAGKATPSLGNSRTEVPPAYWQVEAATSLLICSQAASPQTLPESHFSVNMSGPRQRWNTA